MITVFEEHSAEIPVVAFSFPGGERQVRVETDCDDALIHADIRNSDDIMDLLLVTDALRGQGVEGITLEIPYLPYARQDRVTVPGEALALRTFAKLINAQDYDSVVVWDAHSHVAEALINRFVNVPPEYFVTRIEADPADTVLVAPDNGATKKIMQVAKFIGAPWIQAWKIRDPKTGEITGTKVDAEWIRGKDFLIVDDICDGGRTFIELAKMLKPFTAGKINLYVTHGIFSKGFDVFDGLIDHIYCANPWPDHFCHIDRPHRTQVTK